MFCPNCGNEISNNIRFCPKCGAVINDAPDRAVNDYAQSVPQQPRTYSQQPYQTTAYSENGAVRQGIPAPGFSDRVNNPEILAAVRKNRKISKIFALVIVPLPFIGAVIYSIASGKTELSKAAMYGGIVSAVFLLFALFSFIKERAKNSYEATVIDKKSRLKYRNNNSDDRNMVTEYITIVQTTSGKKKKITEMEGALILAYNYLEVGDRFRYHPQFNFPYELYDKSKAPYICCISCGTKNPVEEDRCKRCKLPLLK